MDNSSQPIVKLLAMLRLVKLRSKKEERSRSAEIRANCQLLVGLLVLEHHEAREDREHHLLLHLDDVLRQRVHQRALLTGRRYRVLGVHLLLLTR